MESQREMPENGAFATTRGARDDFFESPVNGSGASARTRSAARAAGLGWFSVGLGVAELVAPVAVGRLIGAPRDPRSRITLRMLGLREIATGLFILSQKKTAPWLWSRVAGDFIDLALLGTTTLRSGPRKTRLLAATAAVVGVTVVDGLAALQQSREAKEGAAELERAIVLCKALTINRPVDEVYAFWRDFSNQPRFMSHIERVEVNGSRSRWHARAAGVEVSWEAELTEDRPGELMRWQSLAGSALDTDGCVSFSPAPGGRGTEVYVQIRYELPLGLAGFSLGKLFGALPERMLGNGLKRLKQILETGEVVHSEASIHRGPHPARAAENDARVRVQS